MNTRQQLWYVDVLFFFVLFIAGLACAVVMREGVFWILGALLLNFLVGCCVWAWWDEPTRYDGRLHAWAKEAPCDTFYFLIIQLWPLGVVAMMADRRRG